ncbi:MAG: hypothetical protein R2873_20625 [Caldilineaceae bacterium]
MPDWLDSVAGELQISQDELISQGIRVLLENKLQEEEDGSWQDFQRLDTLEYKARPASSAARGWTYTTVSEKSELMNLPSTITILDIPIHSLTYEQTFARIEEMIRATPIR